MTNTAVNVLVIEPIMYCVSSVGAVTGSRRAEPTCADHTRVPSLTMPALTAGECHWLCAPRTRRSRSRTRASPRGRPLIRPSFGCSQAHGSVDDCALVLENDRVDTQVGQLTPLL